MCWCGHGWDKHNHSETYGTYCCHWGIVNGKRQGSCKCKKFVRKTRKNWNEASESLGAKGSVDGIRASYGQEADKYCKKPSHKRSVEPANPKSEKPKKVR